jgi:hypothetical protein
MSLHGGPTRCLGEAGIPLNPESFRGARALSAPSSDARGWFCGEMVARIASEKRKRGVGVPCVL